MFYFENFGFHCFSRQMEQSPLPNFTGTQRYSTFRQSAADGGVIPSQGRCPRAAAVFVVLPPSAPRSKWRWYWPAHIPHHHNTQLERHGCRQIYDPYHGAASKRLFAVKRKRLIKTSLYNRVNIGLVQTMINL